MNDCTKCEGKGWYFVPNGEDDVEKVECDKDWEVLNDFREKNLPDLDLRAKCKPNGKISPLSLEENKK